MALKRKVHIKDVLVLLDLDPSSEEEKSWIRDHGMVANDVQFVSFTHAKRMVSFMRYDREYLTRCDLLEEAAISIKKEAN